MSVRDDRESAGDEWPMPLFSRGRSPVDASLRMGKPTVPVYRRFPTPTVANRRPLPLSGGAR